MTGKIRRLDAKTATYSDFAEVMMANEPAILYNFQWLLPSFETWQKDGRADVDFLRREHGNMIVPVVECTSDSYGEQRRMPMPLSEFLDKVQDGKDRLEPKEATAILEDSEHKGNGDHHHDHEGPLLYLKDWHFQRLRGEEGAAVAAEREAPFFFADDWLNWWWDRQGTDDYRFVYMGPPGSWTPLHHDVLNSYSWSFNVCGRKHWTLFAPEVTPELYDRYGRNLATDVRSGCADAEVFPRLKAAPRIEVHQAPGEAIFVPSGWHHQVVNTGDGITISVNTNWFNGFNLRKVQAFLMSELHAVRDALEHLREDMDFSEGVENVNDDHADCSLRKDRPWERQCELIMRANSALNLTDFARLVVGRAQHLLLELRQPPLLTNDCNRLSLRGGALSEQVGDDVRLLTDGITDEDTAGSRRWQSFALDQARKVLENLMSEPCASHLFLAEEKGDRNEPVDTSARAVGDARDGANPGRKSAEADGAGAEDCGTNSSGVGGGGGVVGSVNVLREVLGSINALLCGRNYNVEDCRQEFADDGIDDVR